MTKRKAAPAAIHTLTPAPTPPERIRYLVQQLIARAAQPGPNGDPDLELGGIAIALAMVANGTEQQLAKLTLQRDLAAGHDQQPYPTAWAYEQACKAARKHRDRADAAEAAVTRVWRLLDDPCGMFSDDEIRAALEGSSAKPGRDPSASVSGGSPEC